MSETETVMYRFIATSTGGEILPPLSSSNVVISPSPIFGVQSSGNRYDTLVASWTIALKRRTSTIRQFGVGRTAMFDVQLLIRFDVLSKRCRPSFRPTRATAKQMGTHDVEWIGYIGTVFW